MSRDQMYTALFDRIREKCQRDGWYGGQLDRREGLRRPDHPQRTGFAYPPASEDDLRATEAALGFALPALLRALYAEIANGGFGPGGGIQGALGGYGSRLDEPASTIDVGYLWHPVPVQFVDLADSGRHWKRSPSGEDWLLPYTVWPEYLLPLEDLGCCQQACLDGKTGRILCTAPSASPDLYEVGPIFPSLQDYLERWLNERF